MRTIGTAAFACALAGSAVGQDNTGRQIRYDFTIEVVQNEVIGSPDAASTPLLTELTVGTTGTISALVTEFNEFATDPEVRWWQMDQVNLDIGSISLQTEMPRYPNTTPFLAFAVLNDANNLGDLIQFRPVWEDAPFIEPSFSIQDLDFASPFPPDGSFGDLLDSTALPTELDLNNDNTTTRFRFRSPFDSSLRITHAVTAVTITVIPAPATLALAPMTLIAARRRRS